ncbi:MAG TPA: HEPN domain-containing protein [Planctomycetota bacterium]|nr:HEPN domain-containing protein [Planctomycetota bacterium]
MKPPEQVKKEFVAQWLAKAETDLAAAETLLSEDHPLYYPSCFHSQQAAEKYIKAFLTWHQVEFPKTHVFGDLLRLVGQVDAALAVDLKRVTLLNPYGVEVRYPGDIPEPTRSQAEEALRVARSVRDAILKALPQF